MQRISAPCISQFTVNAQKMEDMTIQWLGESDSELGVPIFPIYIYIYSLYLFGIKLELRIEFPKHLVDEESFGGTSPVDPRSSTSEVSSSVLQSAWMLSMAGTAVPYVRPHATSLRGLYVPPQAALLALEIIPISRR